MNRKTVHGTLRLQDFKYQMFPGEPQGHFDAEQSDYAT